MGHVFHLQNKKATARRLFFVCACAVLRRGCAPAANHLQKRSHLFIVITSRLGVNLPPICRSDKKKGVGATHIPSDRRMFFLPQFVVLIHLFVSPSLRHLSEAAFLSFLPPSLHPRLFEGEALWGSADLITVMGFLTLETKELKKDREEGLGGGGGGRGGGANKWTLLWVLHKGPLVNEHNRKYPPAPQRDVLSPHFVALFITASWLWKFNCMFVRVCACVCVRSCTGLQLCVRV